MHESSDILQIETGVQFLYRNANFWLLLKITAETITDPPHPNNLSKISSSRVFDDCALIIA